MAEKIDLESLKSLILLNGHSIRSVALEAGVDVSALNQYLHGKSYVSEEKLRNLFAILGLDFETRTLLPTVHRWPRSEGKVPGEKLAKVFRAFLPGGGTIVPIKVREENGFSIWEIPQGPAEVLVSNLGARVIVFLPFLSRLSRMTPSGIMNRLFYNLGEVGEGWKWYGGSIDRSISTAKNAVLSPKSYLRLIKDESMTVSEVDDILNLEEKPWTWDQVVLKLQTMGITPSQAAKKFDLPVKNKE